MPIDIRRCAVAAAHAALTEAFAPTPTPPPHRRRLRPLRAILLGVGIVTTTRVALSPDRRQELLDALASRVPLQELLDELRREEDADLDDPEGGDEEPEGGGEEPEGGDEPDAGEQEPGEDLGVARAASTPADTTAEPAGPPVRRSQAAESSRRRRASRARGAGEGQRPRTPPHRGSRA